MNPGSGAASSFWPETTIPFNDATIMRSQIFVPSVFFVRVLAYACALLALVSILAVSLDLLSLILDSLAEMAFRRKPPIHPIQVVLNEVKRQAVPLSIFFVSKLAADYLHWLADRTLDRWEERQSPAWKRRHANAHRLVGGQVSDDSNREGSEGAKP